MAWLSRPVLSRVHDDAASSTPSGALHDSGPPSFHIDDDFTGTNRADHLTGTTGDDNFDMSQGGNDTVTALAGDDYVYMGAAYTANDKIDGGDGFDELDLNGDYSAGLTLTASSLRNVEEIFVEGGHNYFLTLNNGNVAAGGLLTILTYQFTATDSLHVDGSAVNADLRLRGGAGNDILIGGASNDYLRSNGGTDVIDGGGGYNRISYANATSALTLDFNQQGHAQNTGLGMLTLSNVEDVSGTIYADTITGDAHDNFIQGNGGADTLIGNGGNDWFVLGPDPSGVIPTGVTIRGGSGNDLVDFYDNSLNTAAVTVNLSLTGAQNTGQGTVTMLSIEDAAGTVFNDHLTGTTGNNNLYGNGGDDVLDGGNGADHLYGDKYSFPFDPNGTDGPKQLFDADNPGNDTLIGGRGNDTMTGGGGNDIFYFAAKSGHDIITDFTVGADKIQIHVRGVNDFSDLTIADDGQGGAMVSFGRATVDLQQVAPGSLSSSDFTFGAMAPAAVFAAPAAGHDVALAQAHHLPAFDLHLATHLAIA